jgi:hypothetical protein
MDPEGDAHASYRLSEERAQASFDFGTGVAPPNAVMELLEFHMSTDRVVIHPHNTIPGGADYLGPKYDRLRTIVLDGFGYEALSWEGEIEQFLEDLPTGFVRDPEYGLGLLKELNGVVAAIEAAGAVRLIISKREPSRIEGDTYILAYREFEALRLALGRTHRQAVASAGIDKRILIHNALLTARAPDRFPARTRPYRRDTIFRSVDATRLDPATVSEADGLAAAKVVSTAKRKLAEAQSPALLDLQREIELVTLERLVARMGQMIGQPHAEAAWQAFFLENPFVLSLAFSLPIVAIGDQVSVGGRKFSGAGEKVADFLYRNHLTDNITVVEIKEAKKGLLGSEYRPGLYAPSAELVGAVNQVLDQRYQLQKSIAGRKEASRRYDLESYAMKCLIVMGRAPEGPDRRKSLELFRNNLNDVLVVTYDELLAKLEHLHLFLTDGAAEPAS